jgi:hypothetical protein
MLAAAAALIMAACSPGTDDTPKPGQDTDDTGQLVDRLLPQPFGADGTVEGLDEVLETTTQPDESWVSAPWALVAATTPEATEIKIMYLAASSGCYTAGGFTLNETDANVVIGSYLTRAEGAADCASTGPAGREGGTALKWGTINLARPLGQRTLVHAGLAAYFQAFQWDDPEPEQLQPLPEDTASAPAGDDVTPPADESTEGQEP